jgi:tRNA1Val (adenine37-N6)-methyltransferase
MSNTYFQFKEFTVHQDQTAMKVCTDACLFGGWVAEQIQHSSSNVQHILDIGTGTGLLSLMLGQKTSAHIDAVEIDEAAAQQAGENFRTSPWNNRLRLHHSSIQQFNQPNHELYDAILSNPPFFNKSLKSSDDKKNIAKHTDELSYDVLSSTVYSLLNDDGKFYILLPYALLDSFNVIAEKQHLYLQAKINIRQTEKHSYFRTIGVYTKHVSIHVEESEITIKINNEYSPEFTNLLKDYYLHL